MKKIHRFLVAMVSAMVFLMLACGSDKKEGPDATGALVDTRWKGVVENTVAIGGADRAVELVANINVTSRDRASMTMEALVDGNSAGSQSANLSYTFDGERGTFTDMADGNRVDFVYSAEAQTLTYDLFLSLSGQRIGGTFVMEKVQ